MGIGVPVMLTALIPVARAPSASAVEEGVRPPPMT